MLWIQTQYINVTDEEKRYTAGSDSPYETNAETLGELYRICLANFGRCTGKVYMDHKGKRETVGWTFLKRTQYDNSPQTWLQESWVTVLNGPPEKTMVIHFHTPGGGFSRTMRLS